MKALLLILVVSVSFGSALGRNVVKTLTVNNGGKWGTWHKAEFCPRGQYAYGYQMRIEKWQGMGIENDDTSLNVIKLRCSGDGRKQITSGAGPWGDWGDFTRCRPDDYLVAFSLQVEPFQGTGLIKDDTAANYVKFLCRDFFGGYTEEKATSPGKGQWGEYGGWSRSCDPGSAICGLETRVESPQGVETDDTALNDVKFLCCDD